MSSSPISPLDDLDFSASALAAFEGRPGRLFLGAETAPAGAGGITVTAISGAGVGVFASLTFVSLTLGSALTSTGTIVSATDFAATLPRGALAIAGAFEGEIFSVTAFAAGAFEGVTLTSGVLVSTTLATTALATTAFDAAALVAATPTGSAFFKLFACADASTFFGSTFFTSVFFVFIGLSTATFAFAFTLAATLGTTLVATLATTTGAAVFLGATCFEVLALAAGFFVWLFTMEAAAAVLETVGLDFDAGTGGFLPELPFAAIFEAGLAATTFFAGALIDAAGAFLGATFAETTFFTATFGFAGAGTDFLVADFGVDFAVGTIISRMRLKLEDLAGYQINPQSSSNNPLAYHLPVFLSDDKEAF